jgi:hypothetical protein
VWDSFFSPGRRQTPGRLLAETIGATIVIFFLLQLWRPCYFLTDDNLASAFPFAIEAGRHLLAGHLPLYSDYLYGGHYYFLRDIDVGWHPVTLLPTLLANSSARFWMIDISAFFLLILAAVGFMLLACAVREELALEIPDAYVLFYTLSFVFSTYTLTIGPSWLNFLGSESALPWLTLAILDRRIVRATLLIFLFTLHEFLLAYPPATLANGLFLTLFAAGVTWWRRRPDPLFCWAAGSVLALAAFEPLLLAALDGFVQSNRVLSLPLSEMSKWSIPAPAFFFAFFAGNWSAPVAYLAGDKELVTQVFPFVSTLLACGAAWCLIPALAFRTSWRPLEKILVVLIGILFVWIIRPQWMATAMFHIPFIHSMRWSFREGMQFLFFVHLLLVTRFPARHVRWQNGFAIFSLFMFLAPMPFIRPPSLNPLRLDRELLFSGQAERFWALVKLQLKPGDEIATVIGRDYWEQNSRDIPYTLLGTANFPQFFEVKCISGYSPTAPGDQMPLKTLAKFWFGAYDEDQLAAVLNERPNLRILRIVSTHPIKITLSSHDAPPVDLTPCLRAAGITDPGAALFPPAAH